MKPRSVLLIGAGGWGTVHLRALAASRRWSVVAVADASPQALGEAKRLISHVRCFEDPIEAIDKAECDAIGVVVRNPQRVPILVQALGRGLPVLAEKPLVHTEGDLGHVLTAARRSGAPLMAAQNYRFEPQTRRMAEMVRERRPWGDLRSARVDFRRAIRGFGDHWVRTLPGGPALCMEMGVHHFDLMRFALGANPVRIRATARQAPEGIMAGWGSVDAWIEFPGSTLISYHADYTVAADLTPWGGRWDLDFEGGSLTWHPYADGGLPIHLHTPWSSRWRLDVQAKNPPGLFRFHLVDRPWAELARALDEGREPECSLRDNVQSLAVGLAVMRAAETGQSVDFAEFLEEVMPSARDSS